MTIEIVIVTLVASLLSGLIGVFISFVLFRRLESRKMKIETARKLFASRHDIHGIEFKGAINEVMIVFSDSTTVINAMEQLWKVAETPIQARSANASNDALIHLMKAICRELWIRYRRLPDAYFLRFFSTHE